MWESLRAAHGLNPAECVMAGDKTEDLLFGLNAGFAASCLVLTGKGESRARELGWVLPEGRDAAECRLPERLPGHDRPRPGKDAPFSAPESGRSGAAADGRGGMRCFKRLFTLLTPVRPGLPWNGNRTGGEGEQPWE